MTKAEDRDVQWRLRNEGLPLLHGHTHSKDRVTWDDREEWVRTAPTVIDVRTEKVPQVHVGLDAWNFTPVELGVIAELLADINDGKVS